MKDHQLVALKPGQVYECDNGCGECAPMRYDCVYRTSTTPEGDVVETHAFKAYQSDCCGGTVSIWDEAKNDTVGPAGAPLSELVGNRNGN